MKTEAPTPLTETAERVARVAERCELTSDTSYCDSATGEEVIDSPLQLAADLRSLLAQVAALTAERDRLAGALGGRRIKFSVSAYDAAWAGYGDDRSRDFPSPEGAVAYARSLEPRFGATAWQTITTPPVRIKLFPEEEGAALNPTQSEKSDET